MVKERLRYAAVHAQTPDADADHAAIPARPRSSRSLLTPDASSRAPRFTPVHYQPDAAFERHIAPAH